MIHVRDNSFTPVSLLLHKDQRLHKDECISGIRILFQILTLHK